MTDAAPDPDVTIVVPMKDEQDNVTALTDGIVAACADISFEIVLVDDGSTDATFERVRTLQARIETLRLLHSQISAGQSAAVHSGVQAARGRLICTLDGDGQNPPDQIPLLLAPLLDDKTGQLGLVAGQRVNRQDTLSKRWASLAANRIRGFLLNDQTRDTGCGLKAFRRDAFLELPYFNNMHRYLPALFRAAGWQVAHVDVTHAQRLSGRTKYNNLQRALIGLHDLIGVTWLIRRRKRARAVEITRK